MASMGTHATNQSLFRNLPFHVIRDFSAVSLVALSTCILVVRPGLPVHSVTELIALARARPGTITGGTGGGGSSQHFAMVMFEHVSGVRFNQIAYRGGAPAMADLVAGRIDLIFAPVVEAIEQVRAGQIRAIALTRAARSPQFPDVPAAIEQLPGYVFNSWLGLLGPAGMPAPVVARLSAAVQEAMRRPEVAERMRQLGYDPVGSTAEDFSTFQAAEVPRLAELVRLSGATAD
jgi:tripartite-type tricarboxylate transporter receptor subunit TctC